MSYSDFSRRNFLRAAGAIAGSRLLDAGCVSAQPAISSSPMASLTEEPANYLLRIAVKPIELAKDRIVSVTTYNGQFPGPLLHFNEGQEVTVDIRNDTDRPEQLHWHG
ncbi:MAG TPA: multicopper oxidase domain-containing protein, partial [Acidobacteriaceae bacterium]